MNILIASLMLSIIAQANTVDTVFKKDSPLPQELKVRILSAVEARCTEGVSRFGLKEVSTSVVEVQVDQGIRDYYYTTTFRSTYYSEYHPAFTYITVKSAECYISNPAIDRFEIESVVSEGKLCQ